MIGERNLTPQRGPSVWNREDWSEEDSSRARWLMGFGGAAIAIAGAALAAVGGTMVYRSISAGEPQPEEAAGTTSASNAADIVAAESIASFPASDAPSWTPTIGATTEERGPRTRESRE